MVATTDVSRHVLRVIKNFPCRNGASAFRCRRQQPLDDNRLESRSKHGTYKVSIFRRRSRKKRVDNANGIPCRHVHHDQRARISRSQNRNQRRFVKVAQPEQIGTATESLLQLFGRRTHRIGKHKAIACLHREFPPRIQIAEAQSARRAHRRNKRSRRNRLARTRGTRKHDKPRTESKQIV